MRHGLQRLDREDGQAVVLAHGAVDEPGPVLVAERVDLRKRRLVEVDGAVELRDAVAAEVRGLGGVVLALGLALDGADDERLEQAVGEGAVLVLLHRLLAVRAEDLVQVVGAAGVRVHEGGDVVDVAAAGDPRVLGAVVLLDFGELVDGKLLEMLVASF